MTRSWEICHHILWWLIPWSVRSVTVSSVPLLFWSRLQERPMTAKESASIIRNCLWVVFTSFFVSFCSPFNVVVHWHEDDPVCECSGSRCRSLIRLWIFSRRSNVVIPGNTFHSNSVGMPPIRFISLKWLFFRIPFNFALPSRNRITSHFPTQSTESEKT